MYTDMLSDELFDKIVKEYKKINHNIDDNMDNLKDIITNLVKEKYKIINSLNILISIHTDVFEYVSDVFLEKDLNGLFIHYNTNNNLSKLYNTFSDFNPNKACLFYDIIKNKLYVYIH